MSRIEDIFADIGAGVFPPPDGSIELLPSPEGPVDALIALTGRHVIAADIDPAWVEARLAPGDYLTPMSARFIAEFADKTRSHPYNLDAVLCAPPTSNVVPMDLHEVGAPDHPRVAIALSFRRDVRVFETGSRDGLLIIGRGLGGRWEASFEVEERHRSAGLGRALALQARHLVPSGCAVFMQIAPGNAASMRAAWSAGYRAIGSEILFVKEHRTS